MITHVCDICRKELHERDICFVIVGNSIAETVEWPGQKGKFVAELCSECAQKCADACMEVVHGAR